MRKVALANNEYYHVFNRSIAGFKVYNTINDYNRFIQLMQFYRPTIQTIRYSQFKRLNTKSRSEILESLDSLPTLVDIVCYCIMPTHFHLLLKQNIENGITKFLQQIENSYSRYFNIAHKRKGPLWESRFKSVHIDSDEQLLQLTRYIHLNPTSAGLVKKPEEWNYSSYREYLGEEKDTCNFRDVIDMQPKMYKKFVDDRKDYQKQLSMIKSQLIDNYTG